MPQLLITSLGVLGFSLDGQPLDGFDYDKVRAILLAAWAHSWARCDAAGRWLRRVAL